MIGPLLVAEHNRCFGDLVPSRLREKLRLEVGPLVLPSGPVHGSRRLQERTLARSVFPDDCDDREIEGHSLTYPAPDTPYLQPFEAFRPTVAAHPFAVQ